MSTTLAQRFYTAPDGTSAVRTVTTSVTTNLNGIVTSTTSSSAINYEVADPQGTATESWTTGGAVAFRYYDPYGQQVGPPPGWPDNHDFLGKPQDPDTGYDLLGARQYNPATGAFLSLDPLFQVGDPLAMGGYAYASDDPVNGEDPSGLGGVGICITDGSTCQKNPNTGVYGGGGGGVTSPDPVDGSSGGDPYVPISPHVIISRDDPRLIQLEKAWSWVTTTYGSVKTAENEFSSWWRACTIGPFASACGGAFGNQFHGLTPSYTLAMAFAAGIRVVLGHGASITGYMMPLLLASTGSAQLGRNLDLTGEVRNPGYEAHHMVAENNPIAEESRILLKRFDIGINTAENGIYLPGMKSVPNVDGAVVHRGTMLTRQYLEYVNDQMANVTTRDEALDVPQFMKDDLLAGNTPWVDGGGDVGAAPGE